MQNIGIWIQQHVLLMFAIGIIICNFIWIMVCRKTLNIKWYAALIIAILHDIVGYKAMRLLAIIEVGGDLSRAANMRLFGAVFLLPLLYYAWARFFRHKTSLIMDAAAICLTIGLIFGRFDCLVGCLSVSDQSIMLRSPSLSELSKFKLRQRVNQRLFICFFQRRLCNKVQSRLFPLQSR